ncbi:acetate kinase [Spiroplasma monobiae]|uniref:Acetate kinase n=1 Tax=Spiroplasma monobiae MQ-1 TaxID=1336748 RepID=A0A2K9LTH2_SPISQ|nr:acetate kinase [Spiroplasma monobiae]AUM62379.1 acetate kinase [Spiroplasma monobiae MQ-1]
MILVVNAGSSSIKFRLFNDSDIKNPVDVLDGIAERITVDGFVSFKYEGKKYEFDMELPNHEVAIQFILNKLIELNVIVNINDINAVGFRIVHGVTISKSSIIDQKVFETISEAVKLAPLHNPGAIIAIEAIKKIMPKAKMVACFDTAFHQTLGEEQFLYPVPYSWFEEHGVRKYGFHGISYQYITEKMSEILVKSKDKLNLIVCHLGNGASITCIKNGKSFDTTMGLTPLAGIMMGTRSGDIDPSIIEYMSKELNLDVSKITNILNKESGLLGLSGKSSDMRDITDGYFKGDKNYIRALNKYTQVAADYIVKFANLLGNDFDGIVFTAGIGENSVTTRKLILDKLPLLNIEIDSAKNEESYGDYKYISSRNSKIKVLAVRTNEELMICKDTINLTK